MYNILLLDDDIYRLYSYKDELSLLDFNTTICSEINDFLELSLNNDYDAIIVDICLPDNGVISSIASMGGWRTGLELCKKIREHKSSKLIALTYSTLPEVVEWFTQDESVEYFNKEKFPPKEFAFFLNKVLSNPDASLDELLSNTEIASHLKNISEYATTQKLPELNIIADKLDTIILLLNRNENKNALSSIKETLGLLANISSVLSLYEPLKSLVIYLKFLLNNM